MTGVCSQGLRAICLQNAAATMFGMFLFLTRAWLNESSRNELDNLKNYPLR
jgi:hypothetical protein